MANRERQFQVPKRKEETLAAAQGANVCVKTFGLNAAEGDPVVVGSVAEPKFLLEGKGVDTDFGAHRKVPVEEARRGMVHLNGNKGLAFPGDLGGLNIDKEAIGGFIEEERVVLAHNPGEKPNLALSFDVPPVLVALRVELNHLAAGSATFVAFVIGLFLFPCDLQALKEAVSFSHGEAAASTEPQNEIRADGIPQELHA